MGTAAVETGDYTYATHVGAPPQHVIEAVTDAGAVGRWWSALSRCDRRGDEIVGAFGESEIVFTVEQEPGSLEVRWLVSTCEVLDDWVGTVPTFSVRPNDDGSCELHFRHVGLGPQLERFDTCRAGWDHFMPSLHEYLETGEGRPDRPRRSA